MLQWDFRVKESQFNGLVDNLFYRLEQALDDSGLDLDYETSAGVMTITCEENGSKIILSRQPALEELWVAARSGGFHLAGKEGKFHCRVTGEDFLQLMDRVLGEQCGEPVSLQLPAD